MLWRAPTVIACVLLSGCPDAETRDVVDAGDAPDAAATGPRCSELAAAAVPLTPGQTLTVEHVSGRIGLAAGECAIDRLGDANTLGDEAVIALGDLVAGVEYVARIDGTVELAYVITDCADPAGAGACSIAYHRATSSGAPLELWFSGPASGAAYLVLDVSRPIAEPTQSAVVDVYPRECQEPADCDAARPACVSGRCVECDWPHWCTDPARPICDGGSCVAGPSCSDDDASPPENGDDAPVGALEVALPGPGEQVVISQRLCSLDDEWDYVVLDTDQPVDLRFGSTGEVFAWYAIHDDVIRPTGNVQELPPGRHLVPVGAINPSNDAATRAYTLTFTGVACGSARDCPAEAPRCDDGACVAGPAQCTGDDLTGEAAGDDGPSGAPDITPAAGATRTVDSAICNAPGSELDFFAVTVAAGDRLTVDLTWPDPSDDLDLVVFRGRDKVGVSDAFVGPESVDLRYLPAGTYWLRVWKDGDPVAAATPYTLSVARGHDGACDAAACATTDDDGGRVRPRCDAGACEPVIARNDQPLGALCDDDEDCASRSCASGAHGTDAAPQCTTACFSDRDCARLGDGARCVVSEEVRPRHLCAILPP